MAIEIKSIYEYYAKWIREGRLKVNSDWNKDLKIKFTVQDPCQIVRKSFGDPIADDLRFVVKSVVGEDNFIDMHPNRSNNYCCGGGGGYVPMGPAFKKRRMESGKVKADQIRKTGAKIVVVPCHNCFDQINDLSKEYGLGVKVVHFKTLMAPRMILPDEMKPKDEEAE